MTKYVTCRNIGIDRAYVQELSSLHQIVTKIICRTDIPKLHLKRSEAKAAAWISNDSKQAERY